MGDLNKDLKEYMSRSTKNDTSYSSYSSWFSREKTDSSDKSSSETDRVADGWFADAQSDPLLPSLSKKQRIVGFIICLLMGTFCFCLATLYIPFLVLKARKFSLLYSLGSLLILSSFCLLWGPMNHLKHLFSMARLPFTLTYLGTMFATLYSAIWLKSTVLTVIFAVAQVLALVWFVVSYIPGGKTGLRFFTSIFYAAASKTVSKTLPV